MVDQERDVLAPVAQGGHQDRQHVQPIKQVLAKAAGLGFGQQIAMRGGDDAHVDFDVAHVADAPNLFFFENAQELDLQRQRQLTDLVQK